jgi:hypothetical protein
LPDLIENSIVYESIKWPSHSDEKNHQPYFEWCRDIHQNVIQHNDTKPIAIHHNAIQHNGHKDDTIQHNNILNNDTQNDGMIIA